MLYLDIDTKGDKNGPGDLQRALSGDERVPQEFLVDPVAWLRGQFPTQRSWSSGTHHLMRYPTERTPMRKPLGSGTGVECGWAAKYYLMLEPSVVRENGRTGTYAWEDGLPSPEDIPEAPEWLLDVLLEPEGQATEGSAGEQQPGPALQSLTTTARSLAALGPEVAADYDSWVRVLAAIQSVIDRDGAAVRSDLIELADVWSQQAVGKYRGREEVEAKLTSFKRREGRGRSTLGTLVHMAREARAKQAPSWTTMPERWQRLAGGVPPTMDAVEALIRSGDFANIYTKEDPAPNQDFVLKPAVLADALNFIHAPPKSSKSNFAFYSACEALRDRSPIPGVMELGTRPPQRVLLLTEMPEAMTHGFLDLYDPDYEIRGSRRLLIASRELKSMLTTTDALRDVVTRLVGTEGIDLVIIDTYTAFSAMTAGESISEAADAMTMVNALLAIPATVWCVHHDRKSGGGSSAHVNMLGSTSIRAASSANMSLVVLDEQTTLMRATLEARDPTYFLWLAQRAEAGAFGDEPPEAPDVAARKWHLRLGYDRVRGRVVYRTAEPDLVAAALESSQAKRQKKADDPLVIAAVETALSKLHDEEHLLAADETRSAVHAFAMTKVHKTVADLWTDESVPPPGRPAVAMVLAALEGKGLAIHFSQGKYPGGGRRGGHGLAQRIPKGVHPDAWGPDEADRDHQAGVDK